MRMEPCYTNLGRNLGRTLGFMAEASSSVWYLGPPQPLYLSCQLVWFDADHRCYTPTDTAETEMQHHRQHT